MGAGGQQPGRLHAPLDGLVEGATGRPEGDRRAAGLSQGVAGPSLSLR